MTTPSSVLTELDEQLYQALGELAEARDRGDVEEEMRLLEVYDRFRERLRSIRETETRLLNRSNRTPPAEALALRGTIRAYELLGKLGAGGFGDVYKARDRFLGRVVAIKVFRSSGDAVDDESRRVRFYEEAQVASQLGDPGVPPVFEFGQLPSGRPYLVMKFIPIATLAEMLQIDRPWENLANLPRYVNLFQRICQTLATAHRQRVLHRDLKPSNVMLGELGQVFVMDWGLVKILQPTGRPAAVETETVRSIRTDERLVSGHQAIIGTPQYLPPEVIRGQASRFGYRPDVFGLGAILGEILTGQPPFPLLFPKEPPERLHERIRSGDLGPILQRLEEAQARGIDPDLVALARDCLARNPLARPEDAGAVATRVSAYLDGLQAEVQKAHLREATLQSVLAQQQAEQRVWLMGLFAALAVSLLLVGGLAVWLWRVETQKHLDEIARQQTVRETTAETRLLAVNRALEENHLEEARTALHEVEGLLREGAAESYQVQARQARLDLDFATGCEAVRLFRTVPVAGARFDPSEGQARLEALLHAWGLDRKAPGPTGQRILVSPVRRHLVTALDSLAQFTPLDSERRQLMTLAHAGSREPWEKDIRDPDAPNDPRSRAERLGRVPLERLTSGEIESLVWTLGQTGANVEPVLVRAARLHRGDFWIELLLARFKAQQAARLISDPALQRERYLEALAHARTCLGQRSDSGPILAFLGRLYLVCGSHDEAEDFLQQARVINSNEPGVLADVHLSLARLRRLQNDAAAAESHCRAAIAHAPRLAVGHQLLGEILRDRGRLSEAQMALDRARELARSGLLD